MKRQCRVCLAEKELNEFPKAAHGKDGRRNQCKTCRNLYHKENSKEWYQKNRDYKLDTVKQYAELNQENIKAYQHEYRTTDSYREKDAIRAQIKMQDPNYRRYSNFVSRTYKQRKMNAQGTSTKAQIQARWEYYGGKCYICNAIATETDHVIPLSKGGTNWPANLKPICRSCNARKGNIWPYLPLSKEKHYVNS